MPPRIERILLIQLRRLGDVVLSTALLDDLQRALPTASIDMLVGRHAAPVRRGESVDSIRASCWKIAERSRTARLLRAEAMMRSSTFKGACAPR